jgi:septal ring factor EnvC (AmiA/AmiB activator)
VRCIGNNNIEVLCSCQCNSVNTWLHTTLTHHSPTPMSITPINLPISSPTPTHTHTSNTRHTHTTHTPQEHTQQLKVESFSEENIALKQALHSLKERLSSTTHDMHALYQLKNVSEGEIDAQTKRLRDLEMALLERKGRVKFVTCEAIIMIK